MTVPLRSLVLLSLLDASCTAPSPTTASPTPTYYCVPPGAPIFFAVSALAIPVAFWGAWRDLRLRFGTAHRLDRTGRAET